MTKSRPLPNPTEESCRAQLEEAGFFVNKRGWPDFIAYSRDAPETPVFAIEVKKYPGESLRHDQGVVMKWLSSLGAPIFKWSPMGGLEPINGSFLDWRLKFLDPRWTARRKLLFKAAKNACESCGAARDLRVYSACFREDLDPWDVSAERQWLLCATCKRAAELRLYSILEDLGYIAPHTIDELTVAEYYGGSDAYDDYNARPFGQAGPRYFGVSGCDERGADPRFVGF